MNSVCQERLPAVPCERSWEEVAALYQYRTGIAIAPGACRAAGYRAMRKLRRRLIVNEVLQCVGVGRLVLAELPAEVPEVEQRKHDGFKLGDANVQLDDTLLLRKRMIQLGHYRD